eukprot:scaffold600_cov385-Prasinococcus_capsulatus_cf.AAC.11
MGACGTRPRTARADGSVKNVVFTQVSDDPLEFLLLLVILVRLAPPPALSVPRFLLVQFLVGLQELVGDGPRLVRGRSARRPARVYPCVGWQSTD